MGKKGKIHSASSSGLPLETDFPLSEKDEQAHCMQRMRKLQSEALKLWNSLNDKKNEKLLTLTDFTSNASCPVAPVLRVVRKIYI
ncbi:MAG: hypothetical protein ACXVB0_19580 [Mucilaginibacter sp.]